jgi:hypothetical protein
MMTIVTMSTSVSPGAVMNDGMLWEAAGFIDSAMAQLLSGRTAQHRHAQSVLCPATELM